MKSFLILITFCVAVIGDTHQIPSRQKREKTAQEHLTNSVPAENRETFIDLGNVTYRDLTVRQMSVIPALPEITEGDEVSPATSGMIYIVLSNQVETFQLFLNASNAGSWPNAVGFFWRESSLEKQTGKPKVVKGIVINLIDFGELGEITSISIDFDKVRFRVNCLCE